MKDAVQERVAQKDGVPKNIVENAHKWPLVKILLASK
jgi:nitrate reductase beta subunit